jgi:NAD(P) transhydrogenase subunit alpha
VIIGVPTESYPGERRVALVPTVIPNLTKAGFEVLVESGAGVEAGSPDVLYVEKGAKILPDRAAVFGSADIIVQVLSYGSNDVTGRADLPLLRREQVLVGFLRPRSPKDALRKVWKEIQSGSEWIVDAISEISSGPQTMKNSSRWSVSEEHP